MLLKYCILLIALLGLLFIALVWFRTILHGTLLWKNQHLKGSYKVVRNTVITLSGTNVLEGNLLVPARTVLTLRNAGNEEASLEIKGNIGGENGQEGTDNKSGMNGMASGEIHIEGISVTAQNIGGGDGGLGGNGDFNGHGYKGGNGGDTLGNIIIKNACIKAKNIGGGSGGNGGTASYMSHGGAAGNGGAAMSIIVENSHIIADRLGGGNGGNGGAGHGKQGGNGGAGGNVNAAISLSSSTIQIMNDDIGGGFGGQGGYGFDGIGTVGTKGENLNKITIENSCVDTNSCAQVESYLATNSLIFSEKEGVLCGTYLLADHISEINKPIRADKVESDQLIIPANSTVSIKNQVGCRINNKGLLVIMQNGSVTEDLQGDGQVKCQVHIVMLKDDCSCKWNSDPFWVEKNTIVLKDSDNNIYRPIQVKYYGVDFELPGQKPELNYRVIIRGIETKHVFSVGLAALSTSLSFCQLQYRMNALCEKEYYLKGMEIELTKQPTMKNYIFQGWTYFNSNVIISRVIMNSSFSIFAKWIPEKDKESLL